jgi:hypothetical protein
MVAATHKGSANFVISALDENNESTGDLLVNEIGGYKGVTAFGLNRVNDAVKLKVDADGAWTIKISSLDKAPALDLPVKQEGDKVHLQFTAGRLRTGRLPTMARATSSLFSRPQ